MWGDINEAMSIPYDPDESGLNYVPTQIISERLRHGGLHGVAYRSLLAEGGTNIVLFDIKYADPINQLYCVRGGEGRLHLRTT